LENNIKNTEVKLSLCLMGHHAVKCMGEQKKNPLISTLTLGVSAWSASCYGGSTLSKQPHTVTA